MSYKMFLLVSIDKKNSHSHSFNDTLRLTLPYHCLEDK